MLRRRNYHPSLHDAFRYYISNCSKSRPLAAHDISVCIYACCLCGEPPPHIEIMFLKNTLRRNVRLAAAKVASKVAALLRTLPECRYRV
jgi:hypothetical protein